MNQFIADMVSQCVQIIHKLGPADSLAYGMIIAAIVTLPVLLYGPTAPYGRYRCTASIPRASRIIVAYLFLQVFHDRVGRVDPE